MWGLPYVLAQVLAQVLSYVRARHRCFDRALAAGEGPRGHHRAETSATRPACAHHEANRMRNPDLQPVQADRSPSSFTPSAADLPSAEEREMLRDSVRGFLAAHWPVATAVAQSASPQAVAGIWRRSST